MLAASAPTAATTASSTAPAAGRWSGPDALGTSAGLVVGLTGPLPVSVGVSGAGGLDVSAGTSVGVPVSSGSSVGLSPVLEPGGLVALGGSGVVAVGRPVDVAGGGAVVGPGEEVPGRVVGAGAALRAGAVVAPGCRVSVRALPVCSPPAAQAVVRLIGVVGEPCASAGAGASTAAAANASTAAPRR